MTHLHTLSVVFWADELIDMMDKSGNQLIWTERHLRTFYWIFCAVIMCQCSMYRNWINSFQLLLHHGRKSSSSCGPSPSKQYYSTTSPASKPARCSWYRRIKRDAIAAHGKLWNIFDLGEYTASTLHIYRQLFHKRHGPCRRFNIWFEAPASQRYCRFFFFCGIHHMIFIFILAVPAWFNQACKNN